MIGNFSNDMNQKIKNYNIAINYSIQTILSMCDIKIKVSLICRLVSEFAFCTKLSLSQSSFYTLHSIFEKDISRVYCMILQILQMSEKNARRNLTRHSLRKKGKKKKKIKSQAFQVRDICIIFRNFVYTSSCNT